LSTHELRCQIDRYLISSDFKQLDSIPRYRERAAIALREAETEAATAQEKRLMTRTRAGFDAFFAEYDRLSFGEPTREGYLEILGLMDTVFTREVLEPTREYMRLNEGMLAHGNRENQDLTSRVVLALIGLGFCGIFGGAIGGWLIALGFRRILKHNETRLRLTTQQLNQAIPTPDLSPSEAARRHTSDPVEEIGKTASAVIARLQQTERDALRAEQLAWVGQMAAGIAHEVRNPLMAIKMLVQSRAGRRNHERLSARELQILQDEIVRMEDIITTFLNFARPPQLNPCPADIGTLVTQVFAGTQARAATQGVTLEACLPQDRIVTLVDPNQLRQVLYNLLFNALDVQNGGTIRLRLSVQEESDADYPWVMMQVEDEGTGIPSEIHDRIFEPFVSTKDTGMGLGLSICRRIVESHGGRIQADNRPDRTGACFTVLLPLLPVEPDEPALSVKFVPMMVK
jgi:signal transduction histidine kinase